MVDRRELSLAKHVLNTKYGCPAKSVDFCPAQMFPSIDGNVNEFIVIDESGSRQIRIEDAFKFLVDSKLEERD